VLHCLTSKILLQSLWKLQLEWDESVPMSLHTSWERLKKNLLNLQAVTIPRYTFASGCYAVQVHGFADASSQAYGCCIYIRAIKNGQAHFRLLAAKSRVAPLKTKTNQLCAATLLAQFWTYVKQVLDKCEIESVYFWTDSEITLHWIKSQPSSLAVFVSNRVATIQELSENIS